MMRSLIVLLGVVAAVPAMAFRAPVRSARSPFAVKKVAPMQMAKFDEATSEFAKNFPSFYSRGWGPTTKAERWNGRHAMFGWVAMIATGYCKAHGLIPDFDAPLDLSQWGTLATLYGTTTISTGRAVVLAGHAHALLFSVCATLAPLSFQDKLFLEEGEEDEPAAGLIPSFDTGLTKSAELWNGRVAMLGLCVLVFGSIASGTPVLDCINVGLGGLLLKA